MTALRFEWDPRKARENLRKHGVSFDEARSAFYDEQGGLIDDPDHSADEDRFILLGMSERLRILVVVHAYREADQVIRLISTRTATKPEREQYAERWQR